MNRTRSRRWLIAPALAVAGLSVSQAVMAATDTTEPGAPATTAMTVSSEAAAATTDAMAPATSEAMATATSEAMAPATTADTSATDTGGDAAAPADLSGVCPATVVIQTDWNPEAEHGWVYQMVGDDPVIDATAVSVSGPLVASGGAETGVDIEVRSGGPAIGFQTVTSQMYADDSITLGYVYTDEGIQNAAQFPTVAVYAGMEKNPQMIMWDPATYPDISTIADLGAAGVTIRYFGGAAYMEYFVQSGILSAEQVDGSYDGTPAAFTAAEGVDAQQGFGSAEPYIYENEIADWMKPVAYDYINDAGWENYGESIAVRADRLEELSDCLTALVPIIQQSSVDYLADPAETNALIIDAVNTFNNGWVYTEGVADYAVATMINDGLIGNGPNDTIGDFDLDRVNNLIEIARPVYASLGQEPPADLTADAIVTNQFIDPSIGLPGADGDAEVTAGTEAMTEDTAMMTEDTMSMGTAMTEDTTMTDGTATTDGPATTMVMTEGTAPTTS